MSPATDSAESKVDPLEGGEALEIEEAQLDPHLYGKRIVHLEVRVLGTKFPGAPKISRLREGDLLAGDKVRGVLRDILADGAFANAAAEARIDGDGVDLTIIVVPQRVVAGIDIEGGTLDKAVTLHALGIGPEDEFTEATLEQVRAKVIGVYAEHGYPEVRASVRAVAVDEPLHALIAINVAPGVPRKFTQRAFVILPSEDAEVGDLKKSYGVRSGDRLDETDLAQADRDLIETLHKNGFYKAEVKHGIRSVGSRSDLDVFINAGNKMIPTFEGNISFDTELLAQTFTGGGNNFSNVEDGVSKLRHFYVVHGFYDVEVRAEIKHDEKRAVDHLPVKIRENPRVRVEKRVYSCLPKTVDPDSVGDEIDSFLESELPGEDSLAPPPPDTIESVIGPTAFSAKHVAQLSLSPASTFAPETYDNALKHLRELYLSRGYLNAVIGPLQVVRPRCAHDSPPGECIEVPLKESVHAVCAVDRTGLPIAEPSLPEGATCISDREKGVFCSQHMTLRIAMNLGRQTALYDLIFEGNKSKEATDTALGEIAALKPGTAISTEAIEQARLRILAFYQDKGDAYAEVRTSIEPSADRSRARVRFSIEEREPVRISRIEVRGAIHTAESLIRERVTMKEGALFTRKGARLSEERIAQLGPFASVSVALEDPEVPNKDKHLIVTVTEHPSQYLDPRVGFSTGDGVRFAFEYGHRNIGGRAIALTLRVQLAYLFDFMILDADVAKNLAPLPAGERLARRNSVNLAFPEFGLGPLVGLSIEGLDVRDNQRDFGLTRDSIGPTITYRPLREFVAALGGSLELNNEKIFNADAVKTAINQNPSLAPLLSFPDGETVAVAQRLTSSWDRRDNPFAATSGTYVSIDVQHVNAFPASTTDKTTTPIVSHFMRVNGRLAGYLRFTPKGLSLAVSLAGGFNAQLRSGSETYPDRLFFLGGFDSMRGFLADSLVPEDVAQKILHPVKGQPALTIDDVAIRGGDVMINPRLELRVPLTDTFQIAAFLDTGNVWVDPTAFDPIKLRYAAGGGLRVNTPVGPLAFDYGFNLVRRPWEDLGALDFSIGLF